MHIGIAADHGWFELKVQLTAANKVSGGRAALITDSFSTHQGVEDNKPLNKPGSLPMEICLRMSNESL